MKRLAYWLLDVSPAPSTATTGAGRPDEDDDDDGTETSSNDGSSHHGNHRDESDTDHRHSSSSPSVNTTSNLLLDVLARVLLVNGGAGPAAGDGTSSSATASAASSSSSSSSGSVTRIAHSARNRDSNDGGARVAAAEAARQVGLSIASFGVPTTTTTTDSTGGWPPSCLWADGGGRGEEVAENDENIAGFRTPLRGTTAVDIIVARDDDASTSDSEQLIAAAVAAAAASDGERVVSVQLEWLPERGTEALIAPQPDDWWRDSRRTGSAGGLIVADSSAAVAASAKQALVVQYLDTLEAAPPELELELPLATKAIKMPDVTVAPTLPVSVNPAWVGDALRGPRGPSPPPLSPSPRTCDLSAPPPREDVAMTDSEHPTKSTTATKTLVNTSPNAGATDGLVAMPPSTDNTTANEPQTKWQLTPEEAERLKARFHAAMLAE